MPQNFRTTLLVPLFVIASLLFATLVLAAVANAACGSGGCGQPVTSGAKPTASDCLVILKTAVGSATCNGCAVCTCDVNASNNTSSTDALLCMKKAVGQNVTLNCGVECGGSTTTTIGGSTTTTIPGGGTTTTQPAVTTTTIPGSGTTTTQPPVTTTTIPGGGGTTTTVPPTTTTMPGAFSCTIDTAGCTTSACTCPTDPPSSGFDYHIGHSTGTASGPVGTVFDVNTQVQNGGTIDCGGWTRIGASVEWPGCDLLGCCRREAGDPETANWSVFEIYDFGTVFFFDCFCPSYPLASELKPNMVIQCHLPPAPSKEGNLQATGCP